MNDILYVALIILKFLLIPLVGILLFLIWDLIKFLKGLSEPDPFVEKLDEIYQEMAVMKFDDACFIVDCAETGISALEKGSTAVAMQSFLAIQDKAHSIMRGASPGLEMMDRVGSLTDD